VTEVMVTIPPPEVVTMSVVDKEVVEEVVEVVLEVVVGMSEVVVDREVVDWVPDDVEIGGGEDGGGVDVVGSGGGGVVVVADGGGGAVVLVVVGRGGGVVVVVGLPDVAVLEKNKLEYGSGVSRDARRARRRRLWQKN
jgi:hypothetical protein